MPKILSQAGVSLSDLYDIAGSIVGVDNLESQDVSLVHEMGQTLFSERLVTQLIRTTTGDLAQNIDFHIQLTDLPDVPFRILGIDVISDLASRVNHATVLIRDPAANQEMPIWTWDPALIRTIRIIDDNNAVGNLNQLGAQQGMNLQPNLMVGPAQRLNVPDMAFSGNTNGFGAGTVETMMLLYIAFAEDGSGLSSYGLPVPSW